jgi:DNA ligase-1
MLAVTGNPFDSPHFLYEIKWDGYRCLAYLEESTSLRSRNLQDFTPSFPELQSLHRRVKKKPALLDGEIIAYRDGSISFDALQERGRLTDPVKIKRAAEKNPVLYVVFDLLFLAGEPLLQKPLKLRKELLASAVESGGNLVISEFVLAEGKKFFAAARERLLEGVMAKHVESRYLPGKRSPLWQKFLNLKKTELFICGYEEGRGSRLIGSLLLADYSGGRFFYRGKVGTGFGRKEEEILLKALKPLEVGAPSERFPEVKSHSRLHWVKPELVCTVAYHTLTDKGLLRHPHYIKIRQDQIFNCNKDNP